LNLQGRCELWYINRLKWRFGFIFLKVDFVGIGLMVRSRIRDVVYHEFGHENSGVWAHEFG
jgi:hypothetical protein